MLVMPIAGESALCLRGSYKGLAVGFSAMPNGDNVNAPACIVNEVENTVVAHADAV